MEIEQSDALARTTRVNLLFDFYENLLTEKQRTILAYYYHDDFSLGEIASEFGISRQAVYDNIKRAEGALENYEDKLLLLEKHERLMEAANLLERGVEEIVMKESDRNKLMAVIARLKTAEQTAREGGDDSWQHSRA
ncbi:DNA-binding protein [Paenibacillus agaridevorans]|jgi:predicted DNA-binding protein YlxM (UPF0122 family)|uniref:UPF0122 protein PAT3040_04220 n=1 Tax=Paenibacillus agaridevorans TaxID=171404 RepID=A0A2R5F1G9_9BACL|nr:DNA-binding protein [Paenibacillus agaridevorans]